MERSETRGPYAIRNNTGAVEVLTSGADVGYARDADCSVVTERQAKLFIFVLACPAGWLWSPTEAQGLVTLHVSP